MACIGAYRPSGAYGCQLAVHTFVIQAYVLSRLNGYARLLTTTVHGGY